MKISRFLLFLLIIATISFFLFIRLFSYSTEQDAKKFFEEDLAYTYPDASERKIISIEKVSEQSNEYILKAWVSKGLHTPCPEKIEVQYGYPSRNFIGSEIKLVKSCSVCQTDKKNCHILYPEEAIIASHTYEGTEPIKEFIRKNPDATPSVEFLENFDGYKYVWKINWSSSKASLAIYINQADNSILKIE
ncbi:MAG: hypothetical protein N3D10_00685 [Candidatus Micrarchaeota archaeon]|nr:hypothetical protein [Candidatus Micrarchaeota archaeon]